LIYDKAHEEPLGRGEVKTSGQSQPLVMERRVEYAAVE